MGMILSTRLTNGIELKGGTFISLVNAAVHFSYVYHKKPELVITMKVTFVQI